MPSLVSFERLGLWSGAEDLYQPVRDHLVLAIFELPDSKAEAVRVARMSMMAPVFVTGRRARIASAQAAGACAHTANTDWPGVGSFCMTSAAVILNFDGSMCQL